MRTRLGALVGALLVVTAGCGEEAAPPVEGATVLRYAYQPGDALTYEVVQETSMVMEGDADQAMIGSTLDATMDMQARLLFTYAFAEGPTPDTVEITVGQELIDGGATMTQMGQTHAIPFSELAGEMAADFVIVVDAEGNLIDASMNGQALPTDLLGDLQGFAGQGLNQPQHIGPPFPAEPIGVGSTWETEDSIDVMGIRMDQRGEHAVVAEEIVAGRTTLKIETTIFIDDTSIDVMEMMREAAAMAPLDQELSAEELELTMELFESLGVDMKMTLEESRTDMTVWFDPAAGIVVKAVMAAPMTLTMTMKNIPDAGDMAISADMEVYQSMDLVED